MALNSHYSQAYRNSSLADTTRVFSLSMRLPLYSHCSQEHKDSSLADSTWFFVCFFSLSFYFQLDPVQCHGWASPILRLFHNLCVYHHFQMPLLNHLHFYGHAIWCEQMVYDRRYFIAIIAWEFFNFCINFFRIFKPSYCFFGSIYMKVSSSSPLPKFLFLQSSFLPLLFNLSSQRSPGFWAAGWLSFLMNRSYGWREALLASAFSWISSSSPIFSSTSSLVVTLVTLGLLLLSCFIITKMTCLKGLWKNLLVNLVEWKREIWILDLQL